MRPHDRDNQGTHCLPSQLCGMSGVRQGQDAEGTMRGSCVCARSLVQEVTVRRLGGREEGADGSAGCLGRRHWLS